MLCHQPVPVQNPPIIENIWFCEVHSVSKWCGRDITNECENQSSRGKKDVRWLHLFSMRKELMCSNLCKAWMFLNYIWSESLNSCRRTTRFWWDDLVHHEVLSCWKKHPFCAWSVHLAKGWFPRIHIHFETFITCLCVVSRDFSGLYSSTEAWLLKGCRKQLLCIKARYVKQDVIFACLAVQEEIPRRIEGFIC